MALTLDRKIIEDRMVALPVSLFALSEYSGVGKSRLSSWLSGQKSSLPADVFQRVYESLISLEKLQMKVGPRVPLDFRQVDRIKFLLAEYKSAGEL